MKKFTKIAALTFMSIVSIYAYSQADKPVGNSVKRSSIILSNAATDLGLSLIREGSQTAGSANTNTILSPYGLVNVLGILQSAAGGESSLEIAHLLTPSTDRGNNLGSQIKQLDDSTLESGKDLTITNVNKLWISTALKNHIDPVFESNIKNNFKSDVAPLYFADPKLAANEINSWVNVATVGQIPTLLTEKSLNKNAKAVTTNAVYFKGAWSKQFNLAETKSLPFHVTKDETIDVPTMVGNIAIKEASLKGIDLTEIPFINESYSFLILHPTNASHTLNALEEELSGRDLLDLLDAAQPTEVLLQLPKFKISSPAKSIKKHLSYLGMKKVFLPNADFTPMIGKSALVLDDIFQASGITIDETGAEASASSASIQNAKAFKLDMKTKRIDRPFIFAIIHKPSTAPIFIGKLYKP